MESCGVTTKLGWLEMPPKIYYWKGLLERETGVEPATSSLGNQHSIDHAGLSAFTTVVSHSPSSIEFTLLARMLAFLVVRSYGNLMNHRCRQTPVSGRGARR